MFFRIIEIVINDELAYFISSFLYFSSRLTVFYHENMTANLHIERLDQDSFTMKQNLLQLGNTPLRQTFTISPRRTKPFFVTQFTKGVVTTPLNLKLKPPDTCKWYHSIARGPPIFPYTRNIAK